MAKLMTRVFGLLFVVAFFFCFSACYSKDGLNGTPSDGLHIQNPGGSIGGSPGDGEDDTIEKKNALFAVDEDGNYTFFQEQKDAFKGVQLMSVPPKGQETDNQDTNKERRRFYEDLEMQFYVLSCYATKYLVGQFGGGVSSQNIIFNEKEFKDDYVLSLGTQSPVDRNEEVGDTNFYVIEHFVSGWTYNETENLEIVYDAGNAWILHLGENNIGSDYESNFVQTYEPFIRLRLIEIVSNKLYGTDYKTNFSEVQTVDACNEEISKKLLNFSALGFDFEEYDVEGTVANQFKDFLIKEVIGQDVYDFQTENKLYHEPYYTEEGSFAGFKDINGNGDFDESFYTDDTDPKMFFVDYQTILNTLMQNLRDFVDGNGTNPPFTKVDKMEVQTLEAQDFFSPGLPAKESEFGKNSLTNMNYSEYKSCVLFPDQNYDFDCMMVFVDAQINFKLKIWARFCYGNVSFAVPVCLMDLDSSKDYDWSNTSGTSMDDFDFDAIDLNTPKTEQDEEAEKEDYLDYLFGEKTNHNMVLIPMEYVLSSVQLAILKEVGIRAYDKDLNYLNRGYHTNSQDNTNLADEYGVQEIDEEKNLLCYKGQDNYIEFLFEVVDPQPETEYNFKFIIMPGTMFDENFDPEDITQDDSEETIINTFTHVNNFDFDRKILKKFE